MSQGLTNSCGPASDLKFSTAVCVCLVWSTAILPPFRKNLLSPSSGYELWTWGGGVALNVGTACRQIPACSNLHCLMLSRIYKELTELVKHIFTNVFLVHLLLPLLLRLLLTTRTSLFLSCLHPSPSATDNMCLLGLALVLQTDFLRVFFSVASASLWKCLLI